MLNPPAFRAGTRESAEDGVNLNRAFVEGAGRTSALTGISHRIAAFVREHIWPRVHVVLDLHSGGDVARFAPCASFHPLEDPNQAAEIEETARWFGTPLLMIYQNLTPGLLPCEAERLGKITVGCELGWGRSVQAEACVTAGRGCWRRRYATVSCAGESSRPRISRAELAQRKISVTTLP
jgi:N-alpha-acetyl-L-2,4-diaminobutyrate deacetylase